MHRNLNLALGGAALTLGVVVGLPAAATASTAIDCTDEQVKAAYPLVCVPQGQPIAGGGSSPAIGSGGGAAGGSAGGGSTSAGRGAVASLPFTGDEIMVTALVGAGVVAAGGALLAAGRRRPDTA